MDIGFIGACLGSTVGLIGAVLGFTLSLKKNVATLMACDHFSHEEKLRRLGKLFAGYTCSAVTLMVFLCALALLLRYGQGNLAVYTSALVGLVILLNATLIFFSLRNEKVLRP